MKNLIGNTPLIKIKYEYKGIIRNMYAKLEYYNYTGSIKDRIAEYIIKESIEDGSLKEDMPIIEATSGNTGISFSALGRLYNHDVHIFMPDWVSSERINIMKLYGAKVYLVSKEDGGFKECIRRADELAKELNGFRPNQFDNEKNVLAHYNTTGVEIIDKIKNINAFVNGIGTGGTLMGVGKRLKEFNNKIKIIAIEPDSLPILSKGIDGGSHKIEGIGDDFIPSLVDKKMIDKIIEINDEDAINMSRLLAKKFGLGVGISSGANFLGCVLSEIDDTVTVFTDDLKKYLSTDLSKNINENKNLISNNIKLISLELV